MRALTEVRFDSLQLDNKSDLSFIVNKSSLQGSVSVSGAKNSVLRLLAASLLTSETINIQNYPELLLDAQVHVKMLEKLGKRCKVENEEIVIEEDLNLSSVLEWKGRSIRNTLLILGALVARTGYGSVPLPGGCQIGERKYDLHELVLQSLGAKVWVEDNQLCASAPNGLRGKDIYLPLRSTGATENALLCAALANGTTRIWNPHVRPEVIDLIRLLRKMGADVEVFGQEHIAITGKRILYGAKHVAIPDNMEAITWAIAAVITRGSITINNFPFDDLEIPLIYLRESGARFYRDDNSLIVSGGRCYPLEISTGPYPGINSDMQPLLAVYGAFAKGQSVIVDLRFPGRYGYAEELAKMGVRYKVDANLLRIDGGHPLFGAQVRALDLRAGIALALAGLGANGGTLINDAWQIERGYNNFTNKLKNLGGDIKYA